MNIIVDRHIPFVEGLLEPFASVRYLAPAEITREAVATADAMLIRTRTKCNTSLLEGSPCRFIGTATIGFDHIDREWCSAHGIVTANAPGCNAPAVAQYVFAALANVINRPLSQHTIAIVGVGHVGRIVERWARSLDMEVILVDPPRQRAEGGDCWHSLEYAAEHADIITMHTPLTREGEDATFHLADSRFFNSLKRAPIFINASRGPVTDTQALVSAIRGGKVSRAVVDVWEGEPEISRELLALADIATPHIAGYSHEGKVRAARMALDALSEAMDLPHIAMREPEPAPVPDIVTLPRIVASYDIMADDKSLRANPDRFEQLRDSYHYRHEPVCPLTHNQ